MASDELRRQADSFLELTTLEKQIGRSGGGAPRAQRDDGPADGAADDFDYDDDYDDEYDD